jgi:phosphopantothenoylcysteine decarboxylase/phosphopantothenate--cysteine ligase
MGYALAEAALARGHQVVLISGPVALEPPSGAEFVAVVGADQMFDAAVQAFAWCDAAIMTAAVCDYRPARRLPHKLKKQARLRQITLKPTRDICAHLGSIKGDRVVIGFAMEDHDERAHAEAKLVRKRCDAIVLNGIANVGADRATVAIVTAGDGWSDPVSGPKRRVAIHVVKLAERLWKARPHLRECLGRE